MRQGKKYSPRYVEILIGQVRSPVITLTDQKDTPGEVRQLRNGYQGWTAKMELFAPWNEDLRPCLFLDLDTFVLGAIDDILANPGQDLWLIRDFYHGHRSNSGLMILPKDTKNIWRRFQREPLDRFVDGNFLNRFPHRVMQDTYDGIVSYKADSCAERPKGRIVCWHGKPKPHECGGWVADIWKP